MLSRCVRSESVRPSSSQSKGTGSLKPSPRARREPSARATAPTAAAKRVAPTMRWGAGVSPAVSGAASGSSSIGQPRSACVRTMAAGTSTFQPVTGLGRSIQPSEASCT